MDLVNVKYSFQTYVFVYFRASLLFYFMCICVCVPCMCRWVQKSEDFRAPGAGLAGSCELTDMGDLSKANPGLLEELLALSTAQPTPHMPNPPPPIHTWVLYSFSFAYLCPMLVFWKTSLNSCSCSKVLPVASSSVFTYTFNTDLFILLDDGRI